MRKLSKKISMLMVLAMLVSLFSGIVSASAASAWSFASSKYDVDVKETIVMDKNEYADFDLYKEGEEVTKATYTVKWASSDEDVVWVNAKTGQLRADKFGVAEAGDKAKISATFTNVKNQKSATRYFYIEIADAAKYAIVADIADEAYVAGEKYALAAKVTADGKAVEAKVEFTVDGAAATEFAPAKAGEYTIIATATIDGKAVATEKFVATVIEAGLVSAKQISFNTVALTFGGADAAKAVAADTSKIGSVYYIGENEIQAFINTAKVDEKNPAVVNVTLYNDLSKGVTYKFTYGDKSATVVGVDLNQFVSMTIATTSVPAENLEKVKVNLFNADGVLVKVVDYGFSLEPATLDGAYTVNGTQIYFHNKYSNASATVKATFWMGYDDNGNKIADLTATGTISSYNPDATSISNINTWSTEGTADHQWGGNSAKLVIGEERQLYFKVTQFDRKGDWKAELVHDGSSNTLEGGTLRFVSSNENVVLVDNTVTFGKFYPVGVGSAQIVVYRYFNNDFDGTKQVMGVFNVNVSAYRVLTSVTPSVTNRKLSANVDESYTLLCPNAKDQLGANMGGAKYFLKLENNPTNVKVYATATYKDEVNSTPENPVYITETQQLAYAPGGVGYEFGGINAGSAESGWAENFKIYAEVIDTDEWYTPSIQIGLTVKHDTEWKSLYRVTPVNVAVPGADWGWKYSLDSIKSNIDMNLNADRWNGDISRFATEVKMNIYDNNGYLVKVIDDELTYGSATTGNYFWVVKKNGQDAYGDFNGRKLETITKSGDNVTKDVLPGTYSVVIYKNNNGTSQFIASKNIVVTDSSPKVTAVKVNNKVATTDPGALTGTLLHNNIEFVMEGQVIPNNIWLCWLESEVIVNTNRVSVYRVKIGRPYGVGNFEEWVDVYTTFEKN